MLNRYVASVGRIYAENEGRTMSDPIARKRLKKKMLDRWENEGGRLAANPTSADDKRPTSEPKDQGKELSGSRESTVGVPAALTKRRKATTK